MSTLVQRIIDVVAAIRDKINTLTAAIALATKKYAVTIGDGTTTTFTITHNLGTKDVTVEIYRVASPFDQVFADVFHSSTTTISITFKTAPTASQFRVVVTG